MNIPSFKVTETPHREYQIDLYGLRSDIDDMITWCKETFGPSGNNRRYNWRITCSYDFPNRVFLRRECDLVLFQLKWAV